MESHSQRLRQKIELLRPRMRQAAGEVWNHPNLTELYPDFLFAIHSIIRATYPSMKAAAACAKGGAANDAVSAAMADYLAEHAEEEKGHDEWAIADLEVLGIKREDVWRRVPSPAVSALVGSQYYWMNHFHPVAYLSYIAVLESPPSLDFLEETLERTGLPRDALRTWFFHARLDHGHVREFDHMVDGLPLTDWHHEIMGVNAFHTVELQARVFEDAVERFEADHPALAVAAAR